jgi:hypothetical protein
LDTFGNIGPGSVEAAANYGGIELKWDEAFQLDFPSDDNTPG